MSLRIALCTGQIPFVWGGAESLTDALASHLREYGHEVDIVRIPFRWYPKEEILKGYLAARLINLEESEGRPIDRVIGLKWPGFVIKHSHKVTWLIQQFRQAYDLFGTEFSHFDTSEQDQELRRAVWEMDTRSLAESRRIFSISQNVGNRVLQYNQLHADVLYPPPALDGQFFNDGYGDYIFTVSRLNVMKRVAMLVKAMGQVKTPVRCRIAGRGEEREALERLAQSVGAGDRVEFLDFVEDQKLLALYAGALAVYYAPVDEDYGLCTVEAMKSGKPVLTMADSGGVLEWVKDDVSGFVVPPGDSHALAQRIDQLYSDRAAAERLGAAGCRAVQDIRWDRTVQTLLEA